MHIVLEGLPGSGKTTAAERLALERGFLKIDEMLVPIPTSANELTYVDHDIAKIKRRSLSSQTISDRSYLSTLGYNFANDQCHGTHNLDTIEAYVNEKLATGELCEADLLIYLHVSVSRSLKQQNATNESFWRDVDMLKLSESYILRYLESEYSGAVLHIDAMQSSDDVYRQICQAVDRLTVHEEMLQ